MLCQNMISLFIAAVLFTTATDVVQGSRESDTELLVTIHKVVATWDEAKANCESQGKTLASPFNEPLFKSMKSLIDRNKLTTEYFIGTKLKHDPEPEFISVEGIPLDDMPDSAIYMVEQLDPLEGECLAMNRDGIRVVPCSKRLPYLCYKNSTVSCDANGYEYSKELGNCYTIYRGHRTWSESNKTCADDGAHLVIFNDEHEAKTVVKMFSKESRLPASWVGVRDDTGKGKWHSIHGDPIDKIYNVWHKYSTNMYVSEACALVNADAELFDYFCNYYYHTICEKKARVL